MVNNRQLKILGFAYFNDAVFSDQFKSKELDTLYKKGYLSHRKMTPSGHRVYWISKKGLTAFKKSNILR
jgi:hypothetical protein